MHNTPHPQHAWLQKLVGTWQYDCDCEMAPGEPHQRFIGVERVTLLGDLWAIAEGEGEMPGGIARTRMTLGYNPRQQRFIGSWVGSMMTHMWVYEGMLSPDETMLVLDTTGPDFSDGSRTIAYQDVITLIGHDLRTLTSRVRGGDGRWSEFMTVTYRRTP